MHFVLINQCFHPDTASTGQILFDLSNYLQDQGHKVTIVTSRQRYGTDQLLPVGNETTPTATIKRLRGSAFGKKTLPGRIADFASFYLLAFRELFHLGDADAWLVLTSPPMIGPVAQIAAEAARFSGNRPPPVFHWVMDLYPQATSAHGMLKPSHPIYRICHTMMRHTFAHSAGLIALGDDMRDLILSPHNGWGGDLNPHKIHVVHPWADGSTLTPIDRQTNPLAHELGLAHTFNLVYSGNLGLAHDLDTFLGAINATQHEAQNPNGLRWLFIGSGKRYEQLAQIQSQKNYPHLRLLPFMPREKLTQSLGLADVHLLSQLPQFTGVVVPSKLFGILAAGRPALMVGPYDSECARVISKHNVGRVTPVGDINALLGAIGELREGTVAPEAGLRARQAFEQHYDRPVCCQRITQLLTSAPHG